jgi:hypothetical protein
LLLRNAGNLIILDLKSAVNLAVENSTIRFILMAITQMIIIKKAGLLPVMDSGKWLTLSHKKKRARP